MIRLRGSTFLKSHIAPHPKHHATVVPWGPHAASVETFRTQNRDPLSHTCAPTMHSLGTKKEVHALLSNK